jgi:hypothetical protein
MEGKKIIRGGFCNHLGGKVTVNVTINRGGSMPATVNPKNKKNQGLDLGLAPCRTRPGHYRLHDATVVATVLTAMRVDEELFSPKSGIGLLIAAGTATINGELLPSGSIIEGRHRPRSYTRSPRCGERCQRW